MTRSILLPGTELSRVCSPASVLEFMQRVVVVNEDGVGPLYGNDSPGEILFGVIFDNRLKSVDN